MKIVQVLPNISYGDAVSNDALNIDKALSEKGYSTNIYSIGIDNRLKEKVKEYKNIEEENLEESDIVIYHKAIGTRITYELQKLKCQKVMRYHNITPSKYFKNYNKIAYNSVKYGRKGLEYAQKYIDHSIADSTYNKNELLELGYKNVEVIPVLISFEDYKKEPDSKILHKYKDNKVNILFVGRIAPNKMQEDVIKSFYYYNKYINKESRLILVGNDNGFENYSNLLRNLIKELELENDVIFSGHIKFEEMLAFYQIADIFLCMSEHEGFCVPLIESMYFEVPILAYNSSAIKETLGGSGILINKKNYLMIAELINQIIENNDLKNQIINNQKKQLKKYELNNVKQKLFNVIMNLKINSEAKK